MPIAKKTCLDSTPGPPNYGDDSDLLGGFQNHEVGYQTTLTPGDKPGLRRLRSRCIGAARRILGKAWGAGSRTTMWA